MGMPIRQLVSRAWRETHLIVAKGYTKDFDDNYSKYLLMMGHGLGTYRESTIPTTNVYGY